MEFNIDKDRSVTSCIKVSSLWMFNHLKTTLKQLSIMSAIWSVFMTMTTYFFLPNKHLHDWGIEHPLAAFIVQTIVYAGCILAWGRWIATIYHYLKPQRWQHLLLHLCQWLLCGVCCGVIWWGGMRGASIASSHFISSGSIWPMLLTCIVYLLVAAIGLFTSLPLVYLLPYFLLRPEYQTMNLWQEIKISIRYWGRLLTMTIVIGLIAGILLFIAYLPAIILSLYRTYAQIGLIEGDEIDTTTLFYHLLIPMLFLGYFLSSYIIVYIQVNYAYLYGAIICKEKAKHQLKQHETDQDTIH